MEKSRRRREGGVVAACERSCWPCLLTPSFCPLSPLALSICSLFALSALSLPSLSLCPLSLSLLEGGRTMRGPCALPKRALSAKLSRAEKVIEQARGNKQNNSIKSNNNNNEKSAEDDDDEKKSRGS